jgi:hypothetical protein
MTVVGAGREFAQPLLLRSAAQRMEGNSLRGKRLRAHNLMECESFVMMMLYWKASESL